MSNIGKHPLYMRHYHMMRKCYDDTFGPYEQAGALGIKVCKRWHNIHNFIEDIETHFGLPPNHRSQLARKDARKDYTLANIQGWTDLSYTANHRRVNAYITYKGQTKSCADWAREVGIHSNTIWSRIERGYTVEQAFTKPVNKGIKAK